MRKYFLVVSIIFFASFLLRVVGLSSHPVGFTQDEAGLGYEAYSLLKTGKDQWGVAWPLTFRSFGDYKLPLYSYLAIPSVYLFGLNEFSVRLPGAIFGAFGVVATYLMVSELSGKRTLAALSALFLAISPWHIPLSRGAFEANLTSFFIPFGVWLYLKGLKNPKFMIFSAITFGLNLFSYHSARIFTPIILFVLILMTWQSIKGKYQSISSVWSSHKWSALIFSLFLLTAGLSIFWGGLTRGRDLAIFNPTDHWASMSERRYEAISLGLPRAVSRLFSNKVIYSLDKFVHNYLSYFSLTFLFLDGPGGWGYGMIPGRGVLYLFEIVLILIATWAFIKKRGFKGMNFIVAWIALSPLPASLAKGEGFEANRVALMMPAIQILSAFGLYTLHNFYSAYLKSKLGRIVLAFVVVAAISISFFGFGEDYIYHQPFAGAKSMQYGIRHLVSFIAEVEKSYDNIYISRSVSVPNIWIAFYMKWDPRDVQENSLGWLRYEKVGLVYLDQLDEYSLGKFTFGSLNIADIKKKERALVVTPFGELGEGVKSIKTIFYPDGKPAYYVVESKNL